MNIKNKKIEKKIISDICENSILKQEYSTIKTQINNYPENFALNLSSPASIDHNTPDYYTKDMFYLSQKNLEHDLYISSLRKKLSIIKEERKKSELNVINIKRKIFELKKEEQKSIKQLENTRKYIKNIMNNRTKNNNINKNFDIKITKINNIFQTSKCNSVSPNPQNDSYNTWYVPKMQRRIIKSKNDNISIKIKSGRILHNKQNSLNTETSKNNYTIDEKKIYNKKKVKYYFKNKNRINNNNKNRNKINRENLMKKLKLDEENRMRIEKQIEEIEKEQNSLFSNFFQDVGLSQFSKNIDLDEKYFSCNNIKLH